MSRYVRSKYSEEATMWTVIQESNTCWYVNGPTGGNTYHLPKREYVEVAPPEVWVDVTAECELRVSMLGKQQIFHKETCIDGAFGYRFSKVQLWTVQPNTNILGESQDAFILERRTEGGQS